MALSFNNFKKAFYSIYPRALTEVLASHSVEKTYIETLTNINKEAKAKIIDVYNGH